MELGTELGRWGLGRDRPGQPHAPEAGEPEDGAQGRGAFMNDIFKGNVTVLSGPDSVWHAVLLLLRQSSESQQMTQRVTDRPCIRQPSEGLRRHGASPLALCLGRVLVP